MLEVRSKFLDEFWVENDHFEDSDVINCDETGVYFDTPPRYILAQKGGDASISHADKSCRLTAVLAAKRNGDKLPILFVVMGKPGGFIDASELRTYPFGHFYAVQKNAWIDGDGWKFYLDTILRPEIVRPSLILMDNFEAHEMLRNIQYIEEELSSTVCTLPPSMTSVLQPLDVGVMGPFKAKLRKLYLQEAYHPSSAVEKRMACIKRAIKAWELITPETIKKAFDKAIPRKSS
ncbi:hypothetical protein Ae201684_016604 [Aphanomyces euteiches]|uniref:DDE-1 domain-containing protein n=2 Tax=Aphanomyces euteiches TaxID=100861 RepID=A0A6G0WD23_9STRA|nr:hypothetical protein Ae201684_016604 [Aphanomyces euteiches]